MRSSPFSRTSLAVALLVLLPLAAAAQDNSGIAGVVKDTSGAVLPGVSVEASSPALIERARVAVTDGQGVYRIVDLRPGAYTVTFTLPGFSTVRREGIQLTAAFTATVNADMRVGSLEETITVTGEAPVVDVQNVTQQTVMTRDVIDSIPVGTRSVTALGVLIPGVTTISQDVGGTQYGSAAIAVHGSRVQEQQLVYDGMYYNHGGGRGGSFTLMAPNDGTIQEISLAVGGLSAESETSGVRGSLIPRDGGNTFSGTFSTAFTHRALQSENLSADLIERGLTTVDSVNHIYDINPSFGGPLVRDRLWFYSSVRFWETNQRIAGLYYDKSTIAHVYEADLSRPAYEADSDGNQSLRLTWQASPRNKITVHPQVNQQKRDHFYGQGTANRTRSPEAVIYYKTNPNYFGTIGWTSPVSSRLLVEGGAAVGNKNWHYFLQPEVTSATPAFLERSTGFRWGSLAEGMGHNDSPQFNSRFTVSYVTGSHAAKVGVTHFRGFPYTSRVVPNNGVTLELLNGVPNRVQVHATPLSYWEVSNNIGVFAQDQWRLRRVVLNLGVRFDYYNAYVPAQTLEPGPQVPGRNVSFAKVEDVPNWKNVSPRLGAAYDLFGDGRTAVKVSIGRYMEAPNLTSFTRQANPANAIVTSAFRNWTDSNGDFVPQPNELGPLSDANFGQTVIRTRYSDEARTVRGYNWEASASIEHEIAPRLSVDVGYFRRWYGNFRTTDNLRVTPADYDPFCITAPLDARLPGGGGYEVCGLYDVTPANFGLVDNVITMAESFGTQREIYNGIDYTMSARLPRGIVLSGGANTGRVESDSCFVVDSPQALLNCRVVPPFQTQLKFLGVLPLPWGLQASATFQSIPGPEITASYVAQNAAIRPSLGRNLASGANGTATVPLVAPGTMYGDRLNQFDFRFAKSVRAGQTRVQALIDLYNMFNANPVLAQNNAFGPAWQRPLQMLQGRIVKFGAQLNF
jgi:hypothetical protein